MCFGVAMPSKRPHKSIGRPMSPFTANWCTTNAFWSSCGSRFRMAAESERGGLPATLPSSSRGAGLAGATRPAHLGRQTPDRHNVSARPPRSRSSNEARGRRLRHRPHREARPCRSAGNHRIFEQCHVVASVDDVRTWLVPKLGVICQSTTPPRPCPGRSGHRAAKTRSPRSGSSTRSASRRPTVRRLSKSFAESSMRSWLSAERTRITPANCQPGPAMREFPSGRCESAADLRPAWFDGCHCVGLTAGTSTLDQTIDEVFNVLCSMARRRIAQQGPDNDRLTDEKPRRRFGGVREFVPPSSASRRKSGRRSSSASCSSSARASLPRSIWAVAVAPTKYLLEAESVARTHRDPLTKLS